MHTERSASRRISSMWWLGRRIRMEMDRMQISQKLHHRRRRRPNHPTKNSQKRHHRRNHLPTTRNNRSQPIQGPKLPTSQSRKHPQNWIHPTRQQHHVHSGKDPPNQPPHHPVSNICANWLLLAPLYWLIDLPFWFLIGLPKWLQLPLNELLNDQLTLPDAGIFYTCPIDRTYHYHMG